MKTILLLIGLLSTIIVEAHVNDTRDYYLTISRNQKTMGWILAGSGVGLAVAGVIVGNNDNDRNDPNELSFGPNFDVGLWLLGGGIAAGLTSIPFFLSAEKNAHRAASIGFSNQKIMLPQGSAFTIKMQPTVSLRIAL
jgi:hypothetical protein